MLLTRLKSPLCIGANCEIFIPCSEAPCFNSGECTNANDYSDYSCLCPTTHTGENCETVIPCENSPCQNNGTCTNANDFSSYSCECPETHTGTNCEVLVPCSIAPCQNDGPCANWYVYDLGLSGYLCTCGDSHTESEE